MRKKNIAVQPFTLIGLALTLSMTGCANSQHVNDPWYGWNRGAQTFNDNLDKFVVKPLAIGYQKVTPEFVDQGVSNLFSNINDIGVTVNDMLQFKMLQSGMDASRFAINSTIGIGGLVDVAQHVNLPKHTEDFGQTLGYWGVPSGPYLVLPIFRSSSPRDTLGLVGDALFNPLTYISFINSSASIGTSAAKVVDIIDTRSDLMKTEKIVNEAAVDRYEFLKNAYQQRREYLIHDGNVPEIDLESEDYSPESPKTKQ